MLSDNADGSADLEPATSRVSDEPTLGSSAHVRVREATRFLIGGTTRDAEAPASRRSSAFTAKYLLNGTF
jgi:hypothetical protein